MKPDIELVKEWFSIDPETGILTRLKKHRDSIPDTLNPDRERVDFMGVRYRVSHIAWVLYYGKWPDDEIDHEDHNKKNHRKKNLREASHAQNTRNRRFFNPNGKGVTFRKDRYFDQWQAQIAYEGKKIHLGFYPTPEEAAEAYKVAAIQYHGEFACLD